MRCLYCGKELALLKRLTGGGEFCSEAHKQSYQEEYNRLALSRLLQAQKRGQPAASAPAAPPAPPPPEPAAVAVEEPEIEPVDAPAESAPEFAETAREAVVEESAAEPILEAEAQVSAEPEPEETAGFLLDAPTMAVVQLEETPFLETWMELASGPAMSEWALENGAAAFSLTAADLVALELSPRATELSIPAAPAQDAAPVLNGPGGPALAGAAKVSATRNRLEAGGAIAIDIAPTAAPTTADHSYVQAVGFETSVVLDESALFELAPTAIDFPAEDWDVVTTAINGTGLSVAHTADQGEGASPRASLEALARLHDEMAEAEEARWQPAEDPRTEAPEVNTPQVEVVRAAAGEVLAPEAANGTHAGAENRTIEIAAEPVLPDAILPDAIWSDPEQPAAEAAQPKYINELLEISIRTFPPPKAAVWGAEPSSGETAPLLPHLASLPLRPKIALATGYAPPGAAPARPEAKPAARTQGSAKPAGGKPAARLPQPKPPVSTKPGQRPAGNAAAAKAEPAKTEPAKTEATKPEAINTKAEAAPPEASKPKAEAAKPASPVEEIKPEPKPAAEEAKPKAEQNRPKQSATAKPPAEHTKLEQTRLEQTRLEQTKLEQTRLEQTRLEQTKLEQTKRDDDVPSFGAAQTVASPLLGSLKVKLGIAIVLLVLACVYFLGWGRAHPPASNGTAPGDGSGPSIIMGEGGWVEGWGGDPIGLHGGRQITIYRPSLKLTDYRLEFQGSIDVHSIGWVFRASDPENYYAMKLTAATGLPLKVALYKYLVVNGKQTQVGRVPIDVPVQPDTVFNIRVDIRGPQFTTYIQGQQVDMWTDDQLKSGGAGFLNERDERGKVKSVSIRYLSGGK